MKKILIASNNAGKIAEFKTMFAPLGIDVISLKEDDKNLKVVEESLAKVSKRVEFVTYDENKKEGTYVRLPERNELNADINEALIVEFYNK